MKFPNGYGSCYRLPGNRRKPWAVRISLGKDGGRMKYKYLGYYSSHEEALQCLADYNKDPYDPDARRVTFSQLYYILCDYKGSKVYITAFRHLKSIHDVPFSLLRPLQLNKVISELDISTSTISHIKSLLTVMYKFAVENDFAARDFSSSIDLSRYADRVPDPHPHTVFTEDEIKKLWDNYKQLRNNNAKSRTNDLLANVYCLILIYTGVRVNELFNLKKEDIDLDHRFFYVRESKTAAGVRTVPICIRILPVFKDLYDRFTGPFLCCTIKGNKIIYHTFHSRNWHPYMQSIGMSHRIHDCRHTMVSRLTAAGVETRMIGRIVGHAAGSVTVDVYTHFDMDALLSAVDLLL